MGPERIRRRGVRGSRGQGGPTGMSQNELVRSDTEADLRVVVVDDHATFTSLLALGLRNEDGLACVGTSTSIADGMRLVTEVHPDVVVMDVELGDGDGLDATAELVRRDPDLRVVVL